MGHYHAFLSTKYAEAVLKPITARFCIFFVI